MTGEPLPVALGLGSNLGDRLATLQGAVDLLVASGLLRDIRVSPVYETAPVGGPEQGAYLNAVLVATSTAAPLELLGRAYVVETAYGRERSERWGARTLDVDLLAVGEVVSDDPLLTLPHPRAHERAFVLVPWHDVDPDGEVVGRGRVAVLVASHLGAADVRRTGDTLAVPS